STYEKAELEKSRRERMKMKPGMTKCIKKVNSRFKRKQRPVHFVKTRRQDDIIAKRFLENENTTDTVLYDGIVEDHQYANIEVEIVGCEIECDHIVEVQSE